MRVRANSGWILMRIIPHEKTRGQDRREREREKRREL
jgi:hypothetical protein